MVATLLELFAILSPKRAARISKWWTLLLVALAFGLSYLIWG